MKNHSTAIPFTSFPLRTVEDNVEYLQVKAYLKVIKPIADLKSKSIEEFRKAINNPVTWDESWFANYE